MHAAMMIIADLFDICYLMAFSRHIMRFELATLAKLFDYFTFETLVAFDFSFSCLKYYMQKPRQNASIPPLRPRVATHITSRSRRKFHHS